MNRDPPTFLIPCNGYEKNIHFLATVLESSIRHKTIPHGIVWLIDEKLAIELNGSYVSSKKEKSIDR